MRSESGKTKRASRARIKPALTQETVDRIVTEVEEAVASGRGTVTYPRSKGRPSLTGRQEVSPSVGFRVTPELRARAELVANRRGVSVSALARAALEDFLRNAS